MLRPTWVAAGAQAASNTLPLTPASAATAAGQVELLFVENRNWPISLSDAQGFVLVWSGGTGTAGLAASVGAAIYWRRVSGAAPPAPTVAFPGGHHLAQIHAWDDVQETGTPFGAMVSDVLASSSTAVTIPGFQAQGELSQAIAAVFNRIDSASAQADPWVNASLANVLERADSQSAVGNGGGFAFITGDVAAGGTVAATTTTLATTSQQVRVALELKGRRAPKFIGVGLRASAGGPHNGEDGTGPTWGTHQAGDVGLMLVEHNNADGSITFDDAKGFVAVPNGSVGAGVDYLKDQRLSSYWCRATSGAMEQPVITFPDPDPGVGQDHWVAAILVFRGVPDGVDPFHLVKGNVIGDDAATPSPNGLVEGGTTSADDTLVVLAAANGFDTAVHNAAWTLPPELTGAAEIVPNMSTSFGKGGGFSVAAGVKSAAGSVSDAPVVWNVNSEVLAHLFFALRGVPDAAAPPGALALRRMRAAGQRRRRLGGTP